MQALDYRPRTLEEAVREASQTFPVVLVTGPRQVGKTTLLRTLARPERRYVTFDDPVTRALAREDPALFIERYPPPVLIDEVQYAPEILPYLKMQADEARTPGAFWLTGSQHFSLMRGVRESLAGRVAILTLLGFSRREAHGQARKAQPFLPRATSSEDPFEGDEAPSLADLYTEIWRGAFPALHADPAPDRDLFYRSYVQTYLSRDVRDLAGTVDETRFLRFIKACAARTGNLLNLADLARDAGISPPTARAWLNILVTSFQVHLLEPWHTNRTKRLVRRPKLYFLDTGLCAYLGAWRTPEALESGAQSGAILETYVVTEILKSYWHFGRDAPLYFFRDRDGREIDLLIEQDGRLHPVEIKRAASPTRRWVRAFHALDRLGIPRGRGAVVSLVRRPVPIDAENDALPAGCL